MKPIVIAVLALSTGLTLASPAHAGGVTLGTHLGITHFSPDEGEGLTMLAWPSQSGVLIPVFSPGVRIGVFLDEELRQQLVFDTGLAHLSSNGSSFTTLQLMGAYQVHLGTGTTQPFVNAGIGVLRVGDEDDSFNCMVLGAGFGVRHVLARQQGALRAEVRLDHQFESEDNGVTVLESMNDIGLRLGFDLFLR